MATTITSPTEGRVFPREPVPGLAASATASFRFALLLIVLQLASLAVISHPAVGAGSDGANGGRGNSGPDAEAQGVESRVNWNAVIEANSSRPPDDLEARFYLAIAYANTGMIKESAREFRALETARYEEFGRDVMAEAEQVLEANPEDILSLNVVGFACYVFSDFERAAQCMERLVALDPRNVWTRHYLAVSLSKLGELDKAIEVLKGALSLDPSNDYTHLLLGLAYKEKGWYVLSVLELARAGRAVRELSTLK